MSDKKIRPKYLIGLKKIYFIIAPVELPSLWSDLTLKKSNSKHAVMIKKIHAYLKTILKIYILFTE
ncbi:MAG: hypothetical protein FWH53_09320 [Leptospirales bacterium]|nr:hypothetical protein [Leptospirales bacterium]